MDSGQHNAPAIDGCDLIRTLGSGSTADVYLFHQRNPARDVAVKVGKSKQGKDFNATFAREADIMASLSTHPYILSIYGSGLTAEGLPYLMLEYAPNGSYKEIMRQGGIGVRAMLDLGVKLAGALQTAHTHGVIHRDIKPANILVTAHGLPALSDFGISTSVYESHSRTGFSVPWAPPEVLTGTGGGDEASDIYSLAATLYGLLVGKSPFEYWFHPRTQHQLAQHIVDDELPKHSLANVPDQVEKALRKGMAKDPGARYASALQFARALQEAQKECFGAMTPLVAENERPYPSDHKLAVGGEGDEGRAANPAIPKPKRSKKPLIIGAAILAVVVVVAAIFAFVVVPHMDSGRSDKRTSVGDDTPTSQQGKTHQRDDVASTDKDEAIAAPANLKGTSNGSSITFTWTNPDPQPGDSYAWAIVENGTSTPGTHTKITHNTSLTISDPDKSQTCVQVSIVRSDGRMSPTPSIACTVK
ncbi:serine/threonine-protein kinase [Bifidobacterium sp. ESL0790]|uniref:serine/threonine protein kinase n=1 Tax=Bifidobacterium sp. ESL0790 TaxID=2983233 RepID=UPI0023F67289|nr:serine/threonine-protein kinase [Bifidobacterium sp. ESL0790]WEV72726.1 serine/threonine-protein kinase [Bifidobacterium sp. ESL0790]